ncbi:collagenase-like isoform X1 [Spodoptera litura]|uniref:Collagenase-like isoform X1 n=1 Tax=Spodoptera litura TaxID=69820 RepID=A0A9J7IXY3_SPOLT|nr:collagenase-like isoform X1 [Spodoptera litura]
MKVVLLCVCVVGLVCQALAAQYHERVGIPMAKKIGLQESMRIAGGLASYKGEHPYFAGLIITLKTGITSICGGTLLSHYHVVTIGQCWYDGENEGRAIQVVLGTATLFTGGTRKYAERVTLHEEFDPYTLTNDIAIVQIPYVSYSTYILSIDLPVAYFSSLAGYKAEIIGYGKTSPDATLGENSSLNDVYVTVMNNTECGQIYGDVVTSAIMCTSGANGKGACGGDYGGPLVLRRFVGASGNDMLVGLVSFTSAHGCDAGYPTGYTRITSYVRWINKFL